MQGSIVEIRDDKTIIRPAFAEERQELAIRSAVSATNSWLVPGTWGVGIGGASLFLKLAFRNMVEMSSAMYASPSAEFVHRTNSIFDVGLIVGGTLVLLAIWNARK